MTLTPWLVAWLIMATSGLTPETLRTRNAYLAARSRIAHELVVEQHRHHSQRLDVRPDVERWRTLVEAYFPPSEVDRALSIIRCESGGDPRAFNRRSRAAGLFQHLLKYWEKRSAAAGWSGADPFDPTANVAVAAWLWRTGGWGHWTCA